MTQFIRAFEIGEQVEILTAEDRWTGVVIDVADWDEAICQVEIDQTRETRWIAEDDLGSIPSDEEIALFAALIDRVYHKLVNKA